MGTMYRAQRKTLYRLFSKKQNVKGSYATHNLLGHDTSCHYMSKFCNRLKLQSHSFKSPQRHIFHRLPARKHPPIHRDIDSMRQNLHRRQRKSHIERRIALLERGGLHCACEDDGFISDFYQCLCRQRHCVGAMRDEDVRIGRGYLCASGV